VLPHAGAVDDSVDEERHSVAVVALPLKALEAPFRAPLWCCLVFEGNKD
jgi:hypothetical protein